MRYLDEIETLDELRGTLEVNADDGECVAEYRYYPLSSIEGVERLPFSLKVLLENVLRNAKTIEDAKLFASRIVDAGLSGETGDEIEFSPARVLFQDFTGTPVFVDLAVMREACISFGGDAKKINPQIPCDLVIDHSVIADEAGFSGCAAINSDLEFQRNSERYEFFKWAQESFENVRIVPPGQGICHQLNIEEFASVVMRSGGDALQTVYFDSLVGTDSHTPTANGIGVLGWGVGGIEAEAACLGQPITILVPQVIGVHLKGALSEGVMAMDVALTFANILRELGVVGCFVECFGEGVESLSATQRACISNMSPEYGCTSTLFAVDGRTLDFLRLTGRSEEQIALVEKYAKEQYFWNDENALRQKYSKVIEIDLTDIVPVVAGPSRPHDRIELSLMGDRFAEICKSRGIEEPRAACVDIDGDSYELKDGAIAIAAVTSCTTATDPKMMLQAGMLAKNAVALGLKPKPWVKTIFAPGSHATELLLRRAGLLEHLNQLGFFTCGFGCMSCIGNSGPIKESMHGISGEIELSSVLSGNRNFEGRISPDVSQNYLTTPAHVIAYSIAGTMDFDPEHSPLGKDAEGNDVYMHDIEPDGKELEALVSKYVTADLYEEGARGMYEGDASWQALEAHASDVFDWDDASLYVRRATYFDDMSAQKENPLPIIDGRVLALFGDFITTDHISPAGAIAPDSPAAIYLRERGVDDRDFNTYGSRRGNHEIMARGTFGNVKLQNQLANGKLGGFTTNGDTEELTTIFEAANDYRASEKPSIILAGKMYGSGSSRDWAAKGPYLLGVKAVIAESFERIHRSNLIGMGILPLQFTDCENVSTLGLDGSESYRIESPRLDENGKLLTPSVEVCATKSDGSQVCFSATVRIDTPTEGKYYENGGILQYVLRELI